MGYSFVEEGIFTSLTWLNGVTALILQSLPYYLCYHEVRAALCTLYMLLYVYICV